MNRRWYLMFAVVIAAGFGIGIATMSRPKTGERGRGDQGDRGRGERSRAAPAAEPPSRTAPSGVATREGRMNRRTPRYPPPPIPKDDPGIMQFINGPAQVPPAALESRWQHIDRRLDELFGETFPKEKRAALKRAQGEWIKSHYHAVRAYYRGDISKAELTGGIHKNMVAFARSVETTLTRTEYRRFMDLEPGVDPFVVLVPPGAMVGDTLQDPPAGGAK